MVDVTKTRADLIERAGWELGAKVAGQPMSAEDYDTIDGLVDALIMQLSLDNVVHVQDANAIQPEHFLSLGRLLANEAAISFGQQYAHDVKIANETVLMRIDAMRPTYETVEGYFF
jgi:hypothetical protein